MGMVGEIAIQARSATYYEYIRSRLKEVAQLLLTLFPKGVKNLVEVLRKNKGRPVLSDNCAQLRIEFCLIPALRSLIGINSPEYLAQQMPIRHDHPGIFGQPCDLESGSLRDEFLGTMVDEGDDMSLSCPSRADEESMVRTRRRPQIGNATHESLQDRLAHHEKSLEQILRHSRGGETGDGDCAHRRSHSPFLRAQMYWSAGYRHRTDRPRRSR